ncbi:MAG: metallophosphoesterase family protein [Candidatus Geothermincolia bacterium]
MSAVMRKRWFKVVVLYLTVFFGAASLLVMWVGIDSALLLPEAPTDRNAKQIDLIKQKQKTLKDPEHFCFAVLGDNRGSIRTFNTIINKMNEPQQVESSDNPDVYTKQDLLFAIDMGDLVFNGYDVQFRRFLNQVDNLKMPLLTALGNHDLDPGTHEVAASKTDEKFGSLKNSKNYQKMFGPTYYSFTVGRSYFIVMDISTEFMANTVAQKKYFDDEMKWVEGELTKSQAYKHRFVFSHVPPFKGKKALKGTQKDNPEQFLRNPGYSEQIKNLCVKYNVEYFFGCHLHTIDFDIWPKGKTDEDGSVIMIITGGAGAELWDTNDVRNMNQFTLMSIQELNPVDVETGMPGPTFNPIKVNVPGQKYSYMYVEEPWTMAYTFMANSFAWLMPLVGLLFIGFLALSTFTLKAGGRGPAVAGTREKEAS